LPRVATSAAPKNSEVFVGRVHQPGGWMDVAADFLLLVVYGCVGFFFFIRWARMRKWPSLYLAISAPLGWTLLAMWDLGVIEPPSLLRWFGVATAVAMLWSVVRWDKIDPPRKAADGRLIDSNDDH
jgi:hypothetical protein